MFGLRKSWPLGLSRRVLPVFLLGVLVLLFAVYWTDRPLSLALTGWPAGVRQFFFAATDLGRSDWILIPALLLFCLFGGLALLARRGIRSLAFLQLAGVAAFVFVGVGLPGLASNLIKRAIGRGRPELFEEVGPLGFQSVLNNYDYQSFPSGHATTAFAAAFTLAFLWPKTLPYALIVAAVVGLSRVVVGAHYPTDVVGGVLLGTLGAYAVRNFFASRRWVFKVLPDGTVVRRRFAAVARAFRRKTG